jgi:hypothetical protein
LLAIGRASTKFGTHQDWSSKVLGVRIDSKTELQAQSFANGERLFVNFCVLDSIDFVVGLLEVAVVDLVINSNCCQNACKLTY